MTTNQTHEPTTAREREHASELRELIEAMRERIVLARERGADPEGRLPRLHEGLASPIEMLFELRIKHRGGRYLWLQTAKTIGDAMGAHVGSLGLESVHRGGVRYFVLDARPASRGIASVPSDVEVGARTEPGSEEQAA